MHDCRTNGGHFFVHRPQGHAFRCRRCSERFADSWSPTSTSPASPTSPATTTPTTTTEQRRHPWRCIIERCEYVACDPCSSILMEELAAGGEGGGGGVGGVDEKVVVGEREREGERGGGMEVMEVDEEEEEEGDGEGEGEGGEGARYVVSAVVCRTARQAAAEAAMKRAYVKRAPVRHGGRGE